MLDELRERCGFPFTITSGYRDPKHSLEAKKEKPGTHSQGIAADIYTVSGAERHIILANAFEMGFGGIGVAKTFIHVDIRIQTPLFGHTDVIYQTHSPYGRYGNDYVYRADRLPHHYLLRLCR